MVLIRCRCASAAKNNSRPCRHVSGTSCQKKGEWGQGEWSEFNDETPLLIQRRRSSRAGVRSIPRKLRRWAFCEWCEFNDEMPLLIQRRRSSRAGVWSILIKNEETGVL